MNVFDGDRFVIQPKLKTMNNTGRIMDEDMKPLCYVKHNHSWKGIVLREMKVTGILLEGANGDVLGEIHESPDLSWGRLVKGWAIYDAKGKLRGAAEEKMKLIGSHWVLENSNGDEIASIKGNRKKHQYEVQTKDKQPIARCNPINKDSYSVEILRPDFDSFLILSYVVIQDHVSSWRVTRGFGSGRGF